MTNPGKRRRGDHLDGQPSKQVRLDIVELCGSHQRSAHPMMPDARREGHRARVAQCAISATHNSLKSQRARNLKSPISNNRAVTSKLCIRPTDSAKKSHGLELTCNAQFLLAPAPPPAHYRPRFRALALFGRRLPERASVSSFPASENLHNAQYRKFFHRAWFGVVRRRSF